MNLFVDFDILNEHFGAAPASRRVRVRNRRVVRELRFRARGPVL